MRDIRYVLEDDILQGQASDFASYSYLRGMRDGYLKYEEVILHYIREQQLGSDEDDDATVHEQRDTK